MWKQVALYFRDYDEHLLFEAMNEPRIEGGPGEHSGGTPDGWEAINRLNATFVETVRSTGGNNFQRWLLVTPFGANALSGVSNLVIPPGKHIAVSVHSYDPWYFCAIWGEDLRVWDGSRNQVLNGVLNRVNRELVSKGYHVMVTEFGATIKPLGDGTNVAEVIKWARHLISKGTTTGIKFVVWDNNHTGVGNDQLGLLNRSELRWQWPELIDAMVEASSGKGP
jgi:endoglucanase